MQELFRDAGWVAYPLALCSILALGVILERLYTLSRLRRIDDHAFVVLRESLRGGNDPAPNDPEVEPAPTARIVQSLLPLRGEDAETLLYAGDIALAGQRLRLRQYLGTLATIGATAPFIGLFGTVLGIMTAFEGMSQSGLSGEKMSAGIAEALSATALGLLVAVPSVVAYNYFTGRVQSLMLHVQGHVAQLAPFLRGGGGTTSVPNREKAGVQR
jgi:biopolymer transport protein ExbB